MSQPIEGDAERPVSELDPVTGYRLTPVDALARMERIADIVDSLAYAVGCGLEGTRTAKNIREAVAILRAALRAQPQEGVNWCGDPRCFGPRSAPPASDPVRLTAFDEGAEADAELYSASDPGNAQTEEVSRG